MITLSWTHAELDRLESRFGGLMRRFCCIPRLIWADIAATQRLIYIIAENVSILTFHIKSVVASRGRPGSGWPSSRRASSKRANSRTTGRRKARSRGTDIRAFIAAQLFENVGENSSHVYSFSILMTAAKNQNLVKVIKQTLICAFEDKSSGSECSGELGKLQHNAKSSLSTVMQPSKQ